MEEEIELPECPVCLQVYNNQNTIPRVLACGHSACEACLQQLPQRFPNTIRCPACNQLVNYPQHQGPSALPKNIDLLSFIHQQNPNPKPSSSSHSPQQSKTTVSPQKAEFLPRFWSDEFYSTWKDWLLPSDAISIKNSGKDPLFLIQARSLKKSFPRFCVRENQIVSLLFVASSKVGDSVLDFSYTVRILKVLNQLKESERDELGLLLRASSRGFRICKAYGLWMDLEDGSLFLVCERLNGDLDNKLRELKNGVHGVNEDGLIEDGKRNLIIHCGISGFAMIVMELCEALVGLHSEGLVSGCLALSCFPFNDFSRIFVDPNEVLVIGRVVRKYIVDAVVSGKSRTDDLEETGTVFSNIFNRRAFVSPEVLLKLLHNEGIATTFDSSDCSVGYYSDVWSLACILVSLLVGDIFFENLFKDLYYFLVAVHEEGFAELYRGWVERVSSVLETVLGTNSLHQIIRSCLEFDPGSRPHVTDVWRCIRGSLIEPHVDILVDADAIASMEKMIHCLALGNLSCPPKESEKESQRQKGLDLQGSGKIERHLIEGLCLGKFESVSLEGHLHSVTGFAVGGGFLFSSSFDKTVHMWSLQNFSLVQSLKGHEHSVMAVVFVDASKPFCISADSGGGIFVWDIGTSSEKPLKKWYEAKDWRYSGIHALAVSGTKHVYTGSGDKSIKAWSLQDYTLTCTMNGHKSVVSSLKVLDGVLYSGSWDGSIRLWSLHDHSSLTVLGDDTPGNVACILSLSVDQHMLAAAHENGCVKIWRSDVLSKSIETGNGAILALDMEGKWLFMGGWDRTVNVQELSGDELQVDTRLVGSIACNSVVTALLYWEGKLFVGFADRIIKVYYYGS